MRMWKKSSSRNWNTLNPHWIHNNISKTLPIVRESSQGGGDSWSIQRQSHGIHSRLACKSRFEENPLFPLPPPFHHSMIHHSSYREDNFKLTLSPWNYIANFTFRIFPSNSKIFSHFYARLLFFLFSLQTEIKGRKIFNISRCKNLIYSLHKRRRNHDISGSIRVLIVFQSWYRRTRLGYFCLLELINGGSSKIRE